MFPYEAPRTINATHGAEDEYFREKYRDEDPIDVHVHVIV